MKKFYIIAIVYSLVTTGWIIYLYLNKTIIIKQPAISKVETVIKPVYFLWELPRHEIDMVDSYYDNNNSFHQIYKDTVKIKKDSSEISWITKVDVNSDMQKAVFEYDSIKVKYYEKIVTNTIIDTLLTEKIKEIPFYSNNWFWAWFTTCILFLSALTAIIFG